MFSQVGLILLLSIAIACPITPNTLPIVNGTPVSLASIANGEKLLIGDINSTDRLFVARLKGTPYEMGKAFGTLFKDELQTQLDNFFKYYGDQVHHRRTQIEQGIESKLPKFLAEPLAKGTIGLLKGLLDLNVVITRKYTNPRYYQEIKGIADGSGHSAQDIRRINMLPELIKAACTVMGLWGNATGEHNTLHLRALDWDRNNPINEFPVLIAYHPSDPALRPHVNVAWVGFVGSLTGVSDRISLGEKVWLPPKHSVATTRYGNPWTYLFRDLLYEATDLSSGLKMLLEAHRTCSIHIGLGSVADHSFRMIEFSENVLNIYDDKNYTHYGKNHPKKDGLAYWDKHVQPSGDSCVGELVANVIATSLRKITSANGMLNASGGSSGSRTRLATPSWWSST
jgi:hypothetical protein